MGSAGPARTIAVPPPPGASISNRLQYAAVRSLAALLRLLPPASVAALGAAAGSITSRAVPKRFEIAVDNLERAFGPALLPRERRMLARRVFRHFGRAAFEMITMDRFRRGDFERRFEIAGIEYLHAAHSQGRGVLVFSAHFGNWELGALVQGASGIPTAVITRPLDNPLLEVFFQRLRQTTGNQVIGKRTAVRKTLRALSDGRCVAIVIDQNVRSGARVFVEFFGRLAATTPTLALLALKTGAPIVPSFTVPLPRGGYRCTYLPEVRPELTGDRDRDVFAITRRCTAIIEEQVRARPECWLWMHERWKSRPGADEIEFPDHASGP